MTKVFWIKDGENIDVLKDINFIISNEGNLIISQARFSDLGNYTCGAQNVANRRLSESAFLTVFGNYYRSVFLTFLLGLKKDMNHKMREMLV